MRARFHLSASIVLACLSGDAAAQAPELPLPPGAVPVAEAVREAGAYGLPVGPARDGPPPRAPQQAEVELRAWRIEDGPAPARIVVPIRAALEAAGYEIVLDCAAEACGGFEFRYGIEVLPPPEMHVDLGAFHALSARRPEAEEADAVGVLASRTGETAYLQIATTGVRRGAMLPMDAPASPAPAVSEGLAATLARDGHAVLAGLDFAPGSAALGSAEIPALASLAGWLAADPARRIALVGHTDMTGPLETNLALSRARAQAVRQRLVALGVAPKRLTAHGAGWLAPRAPNATPAGRAANRRVEAVVSGG